MNRWILLSLTLCLLLAPVASATGHEPHGNAYGYERNHGTEAEPDDAGPAAEGDDANASVTASDSQGDASVQQDRCILYEWAGGVEDARVEINPILGILVLSPMDCVEEIIDPEELLDP